MTPRLVFLPSQALDIRLLLSYGEFRCLGQWW